MAFSLNDKHIIVMYHYVEDPRPNRGGIFPCSVEEFERQIAFLSGQYRIASVLDAYRAAQSESSERLCAITFDDGLKDQYVYARPILEKYNAPASFFIITGTLEGSMPFTHKMHTALSRVSADELVCTEFVQTVCKPDRCPLPSPAPVPRLGWGRCSATSPPLRQDRKAGDESTEQ